MIQLLPNCGKAQLVVMEDNLLKVQLTNFGAAMFSVQIKEKNGELEDIALTCDSLSGFIQNRNFYGATVGWGSQSNQAGTRGNQRHLLSAGMQ